MPMPHRTQMQVIRRRLVGREGQARVKELRALLGELPDYKNGPYADIRKWLHDELDRTRVRKKTVHRDSIAVRREGVAQIALVGAPNAGKSSLLQALSAVQIKTGDYAFTTIRPVPATIRLGGVLVQLVEIPGLLEGAADDRGGGRALLGVLRGADAIVYCLPVTAAVSELDVIRAEVAAAGIDLPALVVRTKADEVDAVPDDVADDGTIAVSIVDDHSLDALRAAIWALTGLVRITLHGGGVVALRPPVTVVAVADTIHHELAQRCRGAHVWGPSARHEGQLVGRAHELADGDTVEILQTLTPNQRAMK